MVPDEIDTTQVEPQGGRHRDAAVQHLRRERGAGHDYLVAFCGVTPVGVLARDLAGPGLPTYDVHPYVGPAHEALQVHRASVDPGQTSVVCGVEKPRDRTGPAQCLVDDLTVPAQEVACSLGPGGEEGFRDLEAKALRQRALKWLGRVSRRGVDRVDHQGVARGHPGP